MNDETPPNHVPQGQELPPDYLAPVGPEDNQGFVGIDLEGVPGRTDPPTGDEDEADRSRRDRP